MFFDMLHVSVLIRLYITACKRWFSNNVTVLFLDVRYRLHKNAYSNIILVKLAFLWLIIKGKCCELCYCI